MSNDQICTICKAIYPLTEKYWYRSCSGKNGVYNRCKVCHAYSSIEHKFGLTKEEYINMYNKQDGECLICSKHCPPPSFTNTYTNRALSVDHNHETGKIRGLLCYNCNPYLGWYEKYKKNIDKYLNLGD